MCLTLTISCAGSNAYIINKQDTVLYIGDVTLYLRMCIIYACLLYMLKLITVKVNITITFSFFFQLLFFFLNVSKAEKCNRLTSDSGSGSKLKYYLWFPSPRSFNKVKISCLEGFCVL